MLLAFVTDFEHPDLTEDDVLLAQYLYSKGYQVHSAVWDDNTIDWTSFDCVIVRSPWDYFHKVDAFTAWLDLLEEKRIKVFNPISVLRWNHDKSYLLRLRSEGVLIPQFYYCHKNQTYSLSEILHNHQWSKAVIKPSISGGAYKTWVVELATIEAHTADFEDLLLYRDVIIQKYAHEIVDRGEISMIYFNKKFSHAVCKKAKAGDFRVQSEHGGYHQSYTPDVSLLKDLDTILGLITDPLLYARIDGYLDDQGRFNLMELEFLEPLLFFDSDSGACHRFTAALSQMTEGSPN